MSTRIYNTSAYAANHERSSSRDRQQQSSSKQGGNSSTSSRPEKAPALSTSSPSPIAPYYGLEALSKQASRYISHLFSCPDSSSSRTGSSSSSPCVSLSRFIAYSLYRARLPTEVALSALCLLARLKTRFPASTGSSGQRLWLAAFMISSKALCDDTYSNKSWSTCGMGMFSVKEVNQMEREMLEYLGWEINSTHEELASLEMLLQSKFNTSSANSATSSSNSSETSSPSSSQATSSYPSPPRSPTSSSSSTASSSSSAATARAPAPAPASASTPISIPIRSPHIPSPHNGTVNFSPSSSFSNNIDAYNPTHYSPSHSHSSLSSDSTITSDCSTLPEPSTPDHSEPLSLSVSVLDAEAYETTGKEGRGESVLEMDDL